MRKERVIIDMDEVIADPMGDMIDWYEKTYGIWVNRGYDRILVEKVMRGLTARPYEDVCRKHIENWP